MVNRTATGITGATLPKGNYSEGVQGAGLEQLYFCLATADASLIKQSYSTGVTDLPWIITIE